jgi:hypothetical protein
MNQYERKFDSKGIVLQKQEYHALSIAFYGIMAYDEFQRTKDSVYYHQAIAQYAYFCDTSKVKLFNNDSEMGLPYNFKFHDLNPPWYSGMTQGAAISYVLRYYKLTKDPGALVKAQQLAKFMLKNDNEGGTISCTPENYCFVEEYPNSKNKRQVLNGFINGLIGLHEYLQFFPTDERAKEVHDDGYAALFSFELYDTFQWSSYDRKGRPLTNQYLRYQLTQLEHLYAIYKDERLKRQMMIWSSMANSKLDTEIKFYKYPRYQYGIALEDSMRNEIYKPLYKSEKNTLTAIIDSTSKDHRNVYKKHPVRLFSNDHFNSVRFQIDRAIKAKQLKLKGISKEMYTISLFPENTVEIDFKDTIIKELNLMGSFRSSQPVVISSPQVFYKSIYDEPFFAFLNRRVFFEVKKDTNYVLTFDALNCENLTFFYRFSPRRETLGQVKWTYYKVLDPVSNTFDKDGFIEVMVCFEYNGNNSYIKNLEFKEIVKEK